MKEGEKDDPLSFPVSRINRTDNHRPGDSLERKMSQRNISTDTYRHVNNVTTTEENHRSNLVIAWSSEKRAAYGAQSRS